MRALVRNQIFVRCSIAANAKCDIWFLHGFGDSGLSFREAFDAPLAKQFNFYVPDLPGFGVSPPSLGEPSLASLCGDLRGLIRELSGVRPVVLVGHSLMAIVATKLALQLNSQAVRLISVDGNLTSGDAFFSGLAQSYQDAATFYKFFADKIYADTAQTPLLHRYYASLRFCDPSTLWLLGRDGAEQSGVERSGQEFAALKCGKLYLWGEKSISPETRRFLQTQTFPNICLAGLGHWPMVEQPPFFYQLLQEDLLSNLPEGALLSGDNVER